MAIKMEVMRRGTSDFYYVEVHTDPPKAYYLNTRGDLLEVTSKNDNGMWEFASYHSCSHMPKEWVAKMEDYLANVHDTMAVET